MRRKPISEIPKHTLPRERLRAVGTSNLTDQELVAILLGTGTKKQNVLQLAHEITSKYTLADITRFNTREMESLFHIGTVQATRLLAAVEIGRRIWEETPKVKLYKPEDVLLAVDDIRGKDREYLVALYLNARHELIEQQTVAIGKLNQIHSEPRDVLTKAMQLPCGFVIVAHNHPSGDPTASTDDILWTTRLHNACKLLGISLLDHIIVTKKGFVSLRAEGVIEDRG